MMRPMEVTASAGPAGPAEAPTGAETGLAGAAAGEAVAAEADFMMSSARISPPGPDPLIRAMSTPCSRASLRALGEMRAPAADAGSAAAGAAAAATGVPAAAPVLPVCVAP